MRSVEYETLAQSETVQAVLSAFGTLAGLPVALIPVETPAIGEDADGRTCPFCRLIVATRQGRAGCERFLQGLRCHLQRTPSPCSRRCFAGLTELAAPVAVNGKPVAALVTGGFLQRQPGERAFKVCLHRLQQADLRLNKARARRAYFHLAVARASRVAAALRLLTTLAEYLGELAGHCLLNRRQSDPPCVACAKSFAERHLEAMPRTWSAARAAHVTEPYFCRIFKAATGMTFSEYVARLHVEQAKHFLADPALRITEAAFAAGFHSIPHFNHTFKRYAGLSPTNYRASLAGKTNRLISDSESCSLAFGRCPPG